MALTTWVLFAFAAMQAYVAVLLLLRRPNAARGSLATLFVVNALATGSFVVGLLGLPSAWGSFLEPVSIGLLVLVAELAGAVVGARPPRRWAMAFAGALGVGSALSMAAGGPTSPFLLLAYGFLLVALAQDWARAADAVRRTWAIWLLVAFAPRAVEFLGAFPRLAPTLAESAALLVGLATVSAGALVAARAGYRQGGLAGRTLLLALGGGALLALVRFVGASGEPFVVFFSLGAVRPAGVLAGVALAGLLGATASPGMVGRHAVVILGAATCFMGARTVLPAVLDVPAPGIILGLSAAVAVLSLPAWAWAAERLVGTRGEEAAPPTAPPGDLPDARRRALAALTRHERVMLALRGSSPATLGDPAFSQAGLTETTHVPGKHLSAVVRGINERANGAKLVASTVGTKGVRHYWLTPEGTKRAEELATRLDLGGAAESRLWLGERWFRG